MNLIEQLGGYEKAKGLFNLYEYSISFKYYSEFSGDFESSGYVDVFIPDLKNSLLQYRRQHNIFEVGDDVIFNNTLYKVIEVDDMHVHLDDGAYGFTVYDCDIKHAEGKRLP